MTAPSSICRSYVSSEDAFGILARLGCSENWRTVRSFTAALHVVLWFVLPTLLLLPEAARSQIPGPSRFEESLTREQPGQMYEKQGVVRFKSGAGAETNAAV